MAMTVRVYSMAGLAVLTSLRTVLFESILICQFVRQGRRKQAMQPYGCALVTLYRLAIDGVVGKGVR
jgi:hypothetical protein